MHWASLTVCQCCSMNNKYKIIKNILVLFEILKVSPHSVEKLYPTNTVDVLNLLYIFYSLYSAYNWYSVYSWYSLYIWYSLYSAQCTVCTTLGCRITSLALQCCTHLSSSVHFIVKCTAIAFSEDTKLYWYSFDNHPWRAISNCLKVSMLLNTAYSKVLL